MSVERPDSPERDRALSRIKLLHTVIWTFFVIVIAYVVYAGIYGERGPWVWTAIGLVLMEGVIIRLNDGKCPLTPVAAKYTDRREDNFDIFLPVWLARHNKTIFGGIFFAGLVMVLYRVAAS